MKEQELYAELKREEEDEEDYDVDQADIIREAPSLDEMAKLITVEEVGTLSCFSLCQPLRVSHYLCYIDFNCS